MIDDYRKAPPIIEDVDHDGECDIDLTLKKNIFLTDRQHVYICLFSFDVCPHVLRPEVCTLDYSVGLQYRQLVLHYTNGQAAHFSGLSWQSAVEKILRLRAEVSEGMFDEEISLLQG